MKNGRQTNNDNRKKRGSTARAAIGQGAGHGGRIRANDDSLRDQHARAGGSEGGSISNAGLDTEPKRIDPISPLAGGQQRPNNGASGGIASGDGRRGRGRPRRERRNRSDGSDTADGNEDRNRTKASDAAELGTEDDFRERPLNVRGGGRKRGRPKKLKEESAKMTMVTMLTVASSGLFTSIALLTKHEHWALTPPEAKALAEALNGALDTLPVKYYEQITAIIEKWIPWVHLAFVGGTIVLDRIEQSAKRVEESRYVPREGRNQGTEQATTGAYPFNGRAGFGLNGG